MQKKVWWCCAVSAAVAVFAINLAADHALRHPESRIGRGLIGMYNGNGRILHAVGAPIRAAREAGLLARDTIGALKAENPNVDIHHGQGVSAVTEPTPVTETPARLPGSIVIDNELPPTVVEQPIDDVPVVKEETTPIYPPLNLNDHMPYADEDEVVTSVENGMPPDCREDPNRDTQYPGCPATCPDQCRRMQAPMNGAEPQDVWEDDGSWLPSQRNKGSRFENSLERQRSAADGKGTKKYGWLQRLRKRLIDAAGQRDDVDTMEFRPSDALPFGLGPNPY